MKLSESIATSGGGNGLPWLLEEPKGSRTALMWIVLGGFVIGKTVVDGLQFVPGASVAYFAAFCALLLLTRLWEARQDQLVRALPPDGREFSYLLILAGYLALEAVNLWRVDGREIEGVLKTATPFVLLALWPRSSLAWSRTVLVSFAGFTIAVNALTIPSDFGWIAWGGIRTLKGIYYFKTDLAYALVTSLLLLAIAYARRSAALSLAAVVVGAMVVVTNSRLNYLTYGVVLAYVAITYVENLRRALMALVVIASAAAVFVVLFDQSSYLSPLDVSDTGRFTQGRELIWRIAVYELTHSFGPVDWLLGRGPGYDTYLGYRFNPSAVNNAHNELLHLLLTRGVIGLVVYIAMWFAVVRYVLGTDFRLFQPGAVAGVKIAFLLFALQSVTGNVSEFSTKTWPLLFAILLASTMRRPGAA